MSAKKHYTVCDGKTTLILEPAVEGGYIVTSPLDPSLITEAENIEKAFEVAYDAVQALKASRTKLLKRLRTMELAERWAEGGKA